MASSIPEVIENNRSAIKLLLQVLSKETGTDTMRSYGFEYSQISFFVDLAIRAEFIEFGQNQLICTDKGKEFLRITSDGTKQKDGGFISAFDHMRVEKLDVEEVYLPSMRQVKSLRR
ncbi:hypothetical protein [Thalassospira xiamenensis]|uniref:hypothetical protein n=1 Tax=Thalassospira xiamenensis TaxID=220697 RepID=UPI001FFFFFAA|nr:hypothetical protein [Thalassospira xiamenensis]MCK2167157.1 hypothetical protein [Thalassospira xiamenensis]